MKPSKIALLKSTTRFYKCTPATGLAIVTLSSFAFGQGTLTPPSVPNHKTGPAAALTAGGAPQPTMKTLQQVEPRIDVMTLAPDTDVLHVIDQPGSYYLSENIETRENVAISIRSSSVTLDLNGFQIVSAGKTGTRGVQVNGSANQVTVRNGSIVGFTNGVNAHSTSLNNSKGCLLENLRVTGSSGYGILLGQGGTVRNCTSSNNGGGIFAAEGCVVTGCVACDNSGGTGAAIHVKDGSTVSHCVVRNNELTGIYAGAGSTLLQCTAQGNTGTYGIETESGCVLKQCAADQNVGAGPFSRGISVGTGSSVIGCTARGNDSSNASNSSAQGVGIFAGSRSLVKDCSVEGNNGDGIRCGSDCRIEQNNCIDSGTYGAGVRATGDGNRIDGNHCRRNRYGIVYEGVDNLVIRNSAFGNGIALESGNFSGDGANNAVGPFIYMNDINDAADDRPWGNFTKTPQIIGR